MDRQLLRYLGNYNTVSLIHFEPHNLTGSYATSWTVTAAGGTVITTRCSGTTGYPCIYSGCTASSLSCEVEAKTYTNDRMFYAYLQLTQSGQTRTISAQATLHWADSCRLC